MLLATPSPPPALLHPAALHAQAPAAYAVAFTTTKGRFVVTVHRSWAPRGADRFYDLVIPDDPVKASNRVGTIAFADAGPNTRTTQVFVNLGDNAALDREGFAPFGTVTSGMNVLERLYGGYGEAPTSLQPQIAAQGNGFLKKRFPKLDAVLTARVVPAH